jgi:hypothetical protein
MLGTKKLKKYTIVTKILCSSLFRRNSRGCEVVSFSEGPDPHQIEKSCPDPGQYQSEK